MVIDKIDFPIYGLLMILSIIIGTFYVCINLKRLGFKKEHVYYYGILNIVFALFGSLSLSKIMTNSGLTSYAGLISVIACALIFNKIVPRRNIYLKYAIVSLPLIYSIGKVGCFLAGCCYGKPYNGVLSITYTEGLNIPLFPIQALEALVFFMLFLIFNMIINSKYIKEITLIICALFKLLLDFLRYDHLTKSFTTNQIISVIVIVIGIILIIKKNLKK